MSEILEKPLYEIGCSFLSGFAFKSSDYSDQGVPLIKIGNIQNRVVSVKDDGNHVSEKLVNDKTKKFLLNHSDVLIAMTGQGSVGRVGKLILRDDQKAFLNQRVGKFLCDEVNINKEYLYYILTTDQYQDYLFSTGAGSGQPNLSPELILQTKIPWVNYSEQTAIASVLSSLDDKIDLLDRQNATLEKMAETLFRHWFVEEAKEGWEEGTVSDLFVLQRGFDLPIQNRVQGEYPIYASSGECGYHEAFKVTGPGVTTGRSGVLGNVFYIEEDFWPLNTSLFIKEFKRSSPLHAYFLLRTIDLNAFNAGSAVPTLNRNHVHQVPIEIPPVSLIIQFDGVVSPLYRKIKANQSQIGTLTKLRDTILPKLMSGEIKVQILNGKRTVKQIQS